MTAPTPQPQLIQITHDPVNSLPSGRPFPVRWVAAGDAGVDDVARGVINWEYYEGAIVTVGDTHGDTYRVWGSGVMVAPGLVLTAKHVVVDHYEALTARKLSLYCLGFRSSGKADLWVMRSMSFPANNSDIAFLGVELSSEVDEDWYVSCIPLSVRTPREHETLTLVGYVFDNPEANPVPPVKGVPVVGGTGGMFAAKGQVEDIYFPVVNDGELNHAGIQISCGAFGGMSGGAALDDSGALVGLISWGTDPTPGAGFHIAAWIVGALPFEVTLPWPAGTYEPDTPILKLPEDKLKIIGRETVKWNAKHDIDFVWDRWEAEGEAEEFDGH
ncbi:MAG: trypsin-like serine peptidase [Solirubrobacteraceae bacterium]